ncbi:MAG: M20/M25/M40 family metallo-hydrolase [Flavobacteriales bacterium]|nr:M20/M25/M40 family metallo-hydrolase [Flavobacteriales bacterium]
MKKIFQTILIALVGTNPGYAQNYSENIHSYIQNIEHPYDFLDQLEKYGNKEAGTPGLDSTFRYLKRLLNREGLAVNVQDFYRNNDTLRNIEVVFKGSKDSSVLAGAHYDSWVGAGVNDNGTGDYAIIEFAKLLKDLKLKYTVRLLLFSGEEIDYLGSKHYVKVLNKDSNKIKYMINFDQLGGTISENNESVRCEEDDQSSNKLKSHDLTKYLANCYSLYTNLIPKITSAYSSDYLSFRDSGYVITGVYQDAPYPFYHSKEDLLKYVELTSLQETVKGALAFILHIAEAEVPQENTVNPLNNRELNVYFNGNRLYSKNTIPFEISIYDLSGKEILKDKFEGNSDPYTLNEVSQGLYFLKVSTTNKTIFKKIYVSDN